MTLLCARNIHLKQANKTICQALSLTIQPGEVWAILGPNGCGKTTLLHALAGLHPLSHGDIYLNDNALTTLPRKIIAQSIGLLFQDTTNPFPQTVWDYCKQARYPHADYFNRLRNEDTRLILDALHTVSLTAHQDTPITHLSSGEKRRLGIAALLAQTPAIYLLDEPNNHLDIRMQMEILSHFRRLATDHQAAILLSLHDPNLAAAFSDHTLLLFADGRFLQGQSKALLTSENLSQLYQYPMRIMKHGNDLIWYSAPLKENEHANSHHY